MRPAARAAHTAFPPSPLFPDMTCGNGTKDGAAMTGHHDLAGLDQLRPTGGDGLLYCFAVK